MATLATPLAVSQKTEHKFTRGSHTSTPRYHTKRNNMCSHEDCYAEAHSRVLPQPQTGNSPNDSRLANRCKVEHPTTACCWAVGKNKLPVPAATQTNANDITVSKSRKTQETAYFYFIYIKFLEKAKCRRHKVDQW